MKKLLKKLMGLLLVGLITLMGSLGVILCYAFRLDLTHKITVLWAKGLLKAAGVRLKIKNKEKIKANENYIIISNHVNLYDIPLLFLSLEEIDIKMFAKKSLFYVPLFGLAIYCCEHILIKRDDRLSILKGLRVAKEKLDNNKSILIFPEGRRNESGELGEFKKGAFIISKSTNKPILPIYIFGNKIVTKRDISLRSCEVEVLIGDPISSADIKKDTNVVKLIEMTKARMESLVN